MKKLLPIIIFLLFTLSTEGQDRHYWYQQFGGRSSMLGGAVVGDVRDNSATFYNPAALGFVKNNMLSISANAYSMAYFNIDDALGEGVDVNDYPFLIYPQLIGGFVPFTENQTWKWGYSLMTRNNSSYTIFARYEDTRNAFENIQGDERFIAGYQVQALKQEQWGGVTLGRMINEHWSFGTSMFISYKSVSGSESVFYKAFPQTDEPIDEEGNRVPFYVAKLGESRYYDIPIVNIIWKLGFAGVYDDWNFGFTSTLPAINLWFMNYGDVQRELEISNLNLEGGFLTDYLEIGRLTGQKTKAITPLSFAAGVSKKIPKGKILFSTEYFFKVATHNILEASNDVEYINTPGLSLERTPNLNVTEAYKAVLNMSVALEYEVLESWNLLTSLRTDFNNHEDIAYEDEEPIEPYFSPWDLYHFTLGTQHIGEKSNLTAGVQYSFGFGSTEQYQNFTDKDNSIGGVFNPNLNDMSYQYHGFTVTISYAYKFAE
ncbi:MAG: hypothetical protein KAH10_02355 [Flavobacteriales bacterium]|nr:hypothetical protein [Flavobacteriales bacterium]